MPSTDPERRDALPVGTVLRDFTLQAVIGHGGFGIVYQAVHNELDLTVAIKEYLPVELAVREGASVRVRSGTNREDFEEGLRRFRNEAQSLIDFDSHPSIVSCREFFRMNGTAYLVMAYEDGQSLTQVLAKRERGGRPFTELDLLAVMKPLLEGLARVHAAGVLHRDIKPSNILLRRQDGRPVLIDFGAAKQAATFSKSQAPYTEGYAALEQVADTGKLGPWTDVYGAGAVMWRMVAGGNRPWEPPHPVRVESRSHAALGTAEDPMPSASELGKGRFPIRLLEAIDRCLSLRESERFQDAHELQDAICIAGGQSSSADSIEAAHPSVKGPVVSGQESGSGLLPTPLKSDTTRRKIVWLIPTILVVGLGLALATRWNSGFEETWTNSLGMEFMWIPAGRFVMGSPEDEGDRDVEEHQHEVRINEGFWMKKYEVTQGEWEVMMGTNPSRFSDCGPRCPVDSVSWFDTEEFIQRLNGREAGKRYRYRLPTEAEWEYAARAGTTGSRYGESSEVAWYNGNSGDRKHPVGQMRANAWGLHDMLGNVDEWTSDWYRSYPGSEGELDFSGVDRVTRGGGWVDHEKFIRPASRDRLAPGERLGNVGFRLVRTE